MSIIEVLVLAHLGATALLLVVLWVVIGAQGVGRAAAELLRRAGSADERTAAAATALSSRVDRGRPVHSST